VTQANKVAVAHTLEDMPKLHVIDVTSYGTRAPSPPRSLQMDTNLVVSYSFYLRITPVGSGRTSCTHVLLQPQIHSRLTLVYYIYVEISVICAWLH